MNATADMIPIEHGIYPKNLWNILNRVCDSPYKNNEIIYVQGDKPEKEQIKRQTYLELRQDAWAKSFMLRTQKLEKGVDGRGMLNRIVVLHFDNHYQNITWFWAVVAAGLVPCISIPFKGGFFEQAKYIDGLRILLKEPLFLTNGRLMKLFQPYDASGMRVFKVSQLEELPREYNRTYSFPGGHMKEDDVAMIMLTSGSTGVSKGVTIKHQQLLASLKGKQNMFVTSAKDVFLNWTDFSHVANLMEIHLHALHLGAVQVQVQTSDIVVEPLKLLSLIDKFQVSYTFAPNFLLNSLIKEIENDKVLSFKNNWIDETESMDMKKVFDALTGQAERKGPYTKANWDLGCLRALISGGESNVVETCEKLTDMLQVYNAPCSFIKPGFGMTETCAGCVYSTVCPTFDVACKLEFASIGEPIITAQVRIMRPSGAGLCVVNELGDMQLSGEAVFDCYYNDPAATSKAFTKDGWFKTGDVARIDELGRLHIQGRVQDTLVINGVNHYPHAIEAALEDANIKGMKSSFTAVFPIRPVDSPNTECMVIVYCPTYEIFNARARIDTHTAISKAVVLYSGVRPYHILPLCGRVLTKSALGKLSRSGIRASYEKGDYSRFVAEDYRQIRAFQQATFTPASTRTERIVVDTYNEIFTHAIPDIGSNCNIFNLGVSSADLLRMRKVLMRRLGTNFPITIFFAHPTIRELGAALYALNPEEAKYDPVVVLQPKTSGMTKTPIFFVHPGMGEVLIFMNLARHITDRPVYALRARGFDGEDFFQNMDEIIDCYHSAIKKTQPEGPYALAGYSFGSLLSWEITKRLVEAGDEVNFLATFDQAPFLKHRSRGYDWYECVVSVAFFLGLMDEELAYAELPRFRNHAEEDVLAHIIATAPAERVQALGLDTSRLKRWADLALALKKVTWNYDPEGSVPHMDIFWTVPLIGVVKAQTTEEWCKDYIHQWDQLVEKPEYHFVGGGHRTMISPPNLNLFQKKFKQVLECRETKFTSASLRTPEA